MPEDAQPPPLEAAPTLTVSAAECPIGCDGVVPTSVTAVEGASGAPAVALSVTVEAFPAVTKAGLKLALTPPGSATKRKAMGSAVPDAVVVTVSCALPPPGTSTLCGAT